MNRRSLTVIWILVFTMSISMHAMVSNDAILQHQRSMLNLAQNLPASLAKHGMERPAPYLDALEHSFSSDDIWVKQDKLLFTYDESMRLSTLTAQDWDMDALAWVSNSRYVYNYNTDGTPSNIHIEGWDGTDWVTFANQIFTYENNKLSSIVAYSIDGDVTEDYLHVNHFYDPVSGRLDYVTMSVLFDFTREWIDIKSSYEYDAQGRVNTTYTYFQDQTQQWLPEDKTQISYHPQDSSTYTDFYNQILNQYLYADYEVYPFPSAFYIDEDVEYYFEDPNWTMSNKTQYSYTEDMQPAGSISYLYDGSTWMLDNRDDLTYNPVSNTLDTWIYSVYENGQAMPLDLKTYHFVVPSANDDPVTPATIRSLSAYPNPFNPSTTISFELSKAGNATIDIYNLRGQKVISLYQDYTSKGIHTVKWDGKDDAGSGVGSGMYIVILKSAGNSKSTKVILFK